jgi:hypothetical protein
MKTKKREGKLSTKMGRWEDGEMGKIGIVQEDKISKLI